ncbi:hypothetical protein MRX96_040596 [Rhipicephalus microplus]
MSRAGFRFQRFGVVSPTLCSRHRCRQRVSWAVILSRHAAAALTRTGDALEARLDAGDASYHRRHPVQPCND